MIIALFTGSRDWTDKAAVVEAFEHAEQVGIYYVVTGDQRGLDRLAYVVARERGHAVVPVHAFWKEDGRVAGAVRNMQMVDVARALSLDHVEYIHGYAFPMKDSVGTWDCVNRMEQFKIAYDLRGTVGRNGR